MGSSNPKIFTLMACGTIMVSMVLQFATTIHCHMLQGELLAVVDLLRVACRCMKNFVSVDSLGEPIQPAQPDFSHCLGLDGLVLGFCSLSAFSSFSLLSN